MKASHFAAINIVPLCARLVLCAAFLPMGWSKVFQHSPVSAEESARLGTLGWGWTPPPAATPGAPAAPVTPATPSAPGSQTPSASAPAPASPDQSAKITEPPKDGLSARNVNKLALTLDASGIPAPRATAWLVAVTELLGGALILVGLFARLWGLGLACVMAGAFYTTSLAICRAHPFVFGMEIGEYQHVFTQIALFTLAFGVLLTGAGAASLDRMLMGPPKAVVEP